MKERVKRNKKDYIIKVLGFDPAFAHFGAILADLNLTTLEIDIKRMELVNTEKRSGKGVPVTGDRLRRGRELVAFVNGLYPEASLVFSEIPQGSQSATAATGLGIATGILCCCPLPIVEVTPDQVKIAATGSKKASKDDMIKWSTEKYPHLDWKTKKRQGIISYTSVNEHCADAIGVIHAGIQTDQFKGMYKEWL